MKRFLSVVILITSIMLMAASGAGSTTLQVAIDGEANASIAVDDNASRVIWQAAREMQNCFRLLTSARLHIRNTAPSNSPVFVLGTPESAVIKPVRNDDLVKKINDDGYAVIVRGMKV